IGSNLVAGLNEAGRTDIVVNDALGDAGKWRNLGKRQLADVVPPGELIGWLDSRKLEAVIHLGAISDTTATDADAVLAPNFPPPPPPPPRPSHPLPPSRHRSGMGARRRARRSFMPPRPRLTATEARASTTTGRFQRCGGSSR